MNFFEELNKKLKKPPGYDKTKAKKEKKNKQKTLADYLAEADLENIKKIINKENINQKLVDSIYGEMRPLTYYLKHCPENIKVLKYLFSLKADPNLVKIKFTENVLEAIRDKSINTIKLFIKNGIEIQQNVGGDFFNKSLLTHFVEQNRDQKEIQILLNLGADCLAEEDKNIFALALEKDLSTLYLLLENEINFKQSLEFAYTLVKNQTLDITDKVIILADLIDKYQPDLNQRLQGKMGGEQLPLISIAYNQKEKAIVQLLIEKGFDFKSIAHNLSKMFKAEELKHCQDLLLESGLISENFFKWDYSYQEFKAYIETQHNLNDKLILIPIFASNKLTNQQKRELTKKAFAKNANPDEVNSEFEVDERVNMLYILANSPYFTDQKWFIDLFIDQGASIDFNNNSAILPAIWNNNAAVLEQLLEAGADLNKDLLDRSNLIYAFYIEDSNLNTSQKRIKIFDLIAKYNLDLKTADYKLNDLGHQILNKSIEKEDYAFAEHFLDQTEPYKLDFQKIIFRIMQVLSNYQACELLIKILARLEDLNFYSTYNNGDRGTFIYQLAFNHFDAKNTYQKQYGFKLLEAALKLGADPNLVYYNKDKENDKMFRDTSTLLGIVMNRYDDNRKLVRLLLKYGADYKTKTSRMQESVTFNLVHRNVEMTEEMRVKYLDLFWEYDGIELEERNNLNSTPLIACAQGCHPEALSWLIAKGAEINVRGGFDDSPPIHKAISNHSDYSPANRAKTVEILLNAGADIEAFDSDDFNPLMNAAYYGCNSVVQLLLEKGADVNAVNKAGLTAAHCAVLGDSAYDYDYGKSKTNILRKLKEYGADLNLADLNGKSPLVYSLLHNKREIFLALLELGADPNQKDAAGKTPLMIAVEACQLYYIKNLWNLTADFNHLDNNGEDLFIKAANRYDEKEGKMIIQKLKEKGLRPVNLKINKDLPIQ
ncbi:ankyrin repeat domain-containing protein [Halanaerobium praevalens]|uniref:Uncharacterized protein n=1 Tax=Halanaerobium praevalens (strain ATCC 33744 / DSM 2228 / GSL) TaxID=572479 RepID=E3DNH2_HALPG|nr:ankyrin repeat domain-containing protein [Halanaerobium praevalens]ADO76510.1 hypothetical protein Hprae_0354 [Halanaerobium praevalens DSM 2228]